MTIPDRQLICTRPFEWCEIHPDGSVFLCCPAWLKRPAGNLLQQPIGEIWNGPVARELRKSVLNGSFHNCSRNRCPHLFNKTAPVQELTSVSDETVRAAITSQRFRLDHPPRHLNLCFDRSCNLACPSCHAQVPGAEKGSQFRAQQISTILQEQLLPGVRTLTLSGYGDPFGSPIYLRQLRLLNRVDYPELREVRLHTNGQLLTDTMWDSLPGLQPLVSEIEISLDAASEQTYNLNRPGGSFPTLLDNLAFLCELPVSRTLSMVVQQNNWREIPLLLELGRNYRAKIYLSRLVNWGTFSREEYRQRAVHLPGHPEHRELVGLLRSLSRQEGIDLGNLRPLSEFAIT